MRISDWSSDVCSSDLIAGGLSLHDFSADGKAIDAVAPQQLIEGVRAVHEFTALAQPGSCHCSTSRDPPSRQADVTPRESPRSSPAPRHTSRSGGRLLPATGPLRSEQRRVGKELVSPCSFRG